MRPIVVGYVWCRLAAKCDCAYASAKLVNCSAQCRSMLVCLGVAKQPCTPRIVFLTAWTKIRFSLSSTLQTPLTVYKETTFSEPLGTLFQKSTVFASRLTAIIPSYRSAISHSCRVLAHNKEIYWPICYSAWPFRNFSWHLALRLPPDI